MTDEQQSRLSPECRIIQTMNDKRFTNMEDNIQLLQKNYSKTTTAISDIKEAIAKLTVMQEMQHEAMERERQILTETVKKQAENVEYQNEVLEKGMDSQREILGELLRFRVEDSKKEAARVDFNGKKVAAIAAIISSAITAIGAIIVNLIK